MTITCSAKICKSTDKTLIDGVKIKFYEPPTEKKARDAWDKFCKTGSAKEFASMKKLLCQLHFDQSCFDDKNQLKPNAIPKYSCFRRGFNPKFASAYEEFVKKNKSDNSTNQTMVAIPNDEASKENTSKKMKPYCLTVQIDKITLKPGSTSKKHKDIKIKFISPRLTNEVCNSLGQSFKLRNGKELPAYNQCMVCKKVYLVPSDLYIHLKEHFSCDICKMEFTSKKSHSKHYKIHQSNSTERPFKCHVCSLLFEDKGKLSAHSHIINPLGCTETKTYNCKDCNITFKNDITYRKHLLVHKKESDSILNDTKQSETEVLINEKTNADLNCRQLSSTAAENFWKNLKPEQIKDKNSV